MVVETYRKIDKQQQFSLLIYDSENEKNNLEIFTTNTGETRKRAFSREYIKTHQIFLHAKLDEDITAQTLKKNRVKQEDVAQSESNSSEKKKQDIIGYQFHTYNENSNPLLFNLIISKNNLIIRNEADHRLSSNNNYNGNSLQDHDHHTETQVQTLYQEFLNFVNKNIDSEKLTIELNKTSKETKQSCYYSTAKFTCFLGTITAISSLIFLALHIVIKKGVLKKEFPCKSNSRFGLNSFIVAFAASLILFASAIALYCWEPNSKTEDMKKSYKPNSQVNIEDNQKEIVKKADSSPGIGHDA